MAIVKGAGLVMKAIIEVNFSVGMMMIESSFVFMVYDDNQPVFV